MLRDERNDLKQQHSVNNRGMTKPVIEKIKMRGQRDVAWLVVTSEDSHQPSPTHVACPAYYEKQYVNGYYSQVNAEKK